jgi:maleate isomerase
MAAPVPLDANPQQLEPGGVYVWVRQNTPVEADAVFLAGNGFRTVSLIAALEAELGRPVLSANQVLLWAALHAATDDPPRVGGYGRLFDVG